MPRIGGEIDMKRATFKALFLCVIVTLGLQASSQTFETIFNFDGTDGVAPQYAALTQGADGSFYGTTTAGGLGLGTVFKVDSLGSEAVLYSFCAQSNCADGANPYAAVVQASDGNFYGTTFSGGLYGYGTVFQITPAGAYMVLHSFCSEGYPCPDGGNPTSTLIQANDGNLYGTSGGAGTLGNAGTVFKITLGGQFTNLHTFCSQPGCADGAEPFGGIMQASDGNFYGTTTSGGTVQGTVYRMNASGNLSTIYDFCSQFNCTDGNDPKGTLVQAADGNLYGTTSLGGSTKKDDGVGTVFKITLGGKLTTTYTFCEHPSGGGYCPDSGIPLVGLAIASNGYLAGATSLHPTIFGVSPTGNFVQYTEAGNTSAGLLQGTTGTFYGFGWPGSGGSGMIFSLGVGLGPFIKTSPAFGAAGASVNILGNDLSGATGVTFNGTPANFTVVSDSEIVATVPSGATTGRVKVTTPNRTLTSNLPFDVTR